MDWTTILTSAAVGALVAGLVQLVAQALERRHSERELIFRFSWDAARAKREDALFTRNETPKEERRGLLIPDPLYLAADYYPLVKRLLRTGRHPKEVKPHRLAGSHPEDPSGLR